MDTKKKREPVPFDDYDWDELNAEQRAAATKLGYTKKLWDNDKDTPITKNDGWDDLEPENREAAKVLGYTRATWDDDSDGPQPAFRVKYANAGKKGGKDKKALTVDGHDVEAYEKKLREDGYAVLKNVFSKDQMDKLRKGYEKLWSKVQEEMKGKSADSDNKVYLNDDDDDDNVVEKLGKNRWDFTRGMDKGVFTSKWFFKNNLVQELARRLLVRQFSHYAGALPTGAHAGKGSWHRDPDELFDEEVNVKLPPFYITVLVPLTPTTKENGATELVPGSHKKRIADLDADPHVFAEADVGDVIMFDGYVYHRGPANNSDEERPVLYMVYAKTWYNEP